MAQHNPPLSLTAPLPHIAIVSPLSCQKNALCALPQCSLRPSIPMPPRPHGNVPFPSRPVSDVFRHFQACYPRPDPIRHYWMKKILVRRYLSDLPGYTHPKILGDQNRFTIPNDHREKTVLPAAALPLGVRESSSPKAFRGNPLFEKSLLVLFVLFSYTYLVWSIFGRRQATPLFCPCRFFPHPPMVLASQSPCLFLTETPSPPPSMGQKRQASLPDARRTT